RRTLPAGIESRVLVCLAAVNKQQSTGHMLLTPPAIHSSPVSADEPCQLGLNHGFWYVWPR
ncbi:hypothetical protein J6590_008857, partial [Homalodisca vitripennis]